MTNLTLPTRALGTLSRRRILALALPLLISACASPATDAMRRAETARLVNADLAPLYAEIDDNGTIIPAIDVSQIDRRNLRQLVDYDTRETPGTVVVDPRARFLYLVMPGGKAMRYGVGVAKAGLAFEGRASVGRKATWPGWTPTSAMIKREPARYGPYARGLQGGLSNPLGARALYLYKDGTDTLYRIHGTTEPWSIGKRVSSGCVRLFNQDIMDLFSRVPTGSRVVVLGAGPAEPEDDNFTGDDDPAPETPEE